MSSWFSDALIIVVRKDHPLRAVQGPARKAEGREAKLSYGASLLVENCNGLIMDAELLEANGSGVL